MCIESIVAEKDIMAARERNKVKWNEGKTLHDKMKEWRAPSGGKMFAAGEVRLGVCILDKVKQNIKEQAVKKRKAIEKATSKYADTVRKSEEI